MKPKIKYPRRCVTSRCRGFVASKRCKSNKCAKCRWRIYVDKNPLGAAFKTLRNHAKERGKEFTLTFDQFRRFAEKTDYLTRKGRTTLSLQIDRINDEKGYHIWNVRAVELRINTRRQFVKYWKEYEQRTMDQTSTSISEQYMNEI